ncbi:hypothetical protein T11_17863 [Trichinella zimbabwensis]|uniref:Four helix bundle protein n=1 Tax=Trichinella zimbabwensis TaxID=268475 RepID=A0A0V1HAG6_9BILA|nr:hypothetical protein T11_17863 [Trichinella zimbabwensis]
MPQPSSMKSPSLQLSCLLVKIYDAMFECKRLHNVCQMYKGMLNSIKSSGLNGDDDQSKNLSRMIAEVESKVVLNAKKLYKRIHLAEDFIETFRNKIDDDEMVTVTQRNIQEAKAWLSQMANIYQYHDDYSQ